MYNDKYIIEPKGMELVSFYKEYEKMPADKLPYVFTPMHYHSDFEILYIKSGKAKININSEVFIAEKGSLILVNPYELHYGEILSSYFSYFCLDFNISILSLSDEDKIKNEEVRYNHHIPSYDGKYIENIYSLYSDTPCGWMLCTKGNLYLLFSTLESEKITTSQNKDSEFSKKVFSYIEKNFTNSITSKTAAEALSFNQSYFCRLFRKNFSASFSEFLLSYRIKKAKELLRKENVSTTAMLCGFSELSRFSAEFKKHCGITPIKYHQMSNRDV